MYTSTSIDTDFNYCFLEAASSNDNSGDYWKLTNVQIFLAIIGSIRQAQIDGDSYVDINKVLKNCPDWGEKDIIVNFTINETKIHISLEMSFWSNPTFDPYPQEKNEIPFYRGPKRDYTWDHLQFMQWNNGSKNTPFFDIYIRRPSKYDNSHNNLFLDYIRGE